jgi:hypothetical protein
VKRSVLLSLLLAACAAEPTRHVESHAAPSRVAKFGRMFSSHNEALPALDTAYRALERGLRAHDCLACHAPDGEAHDAPMVYAAKAFELRHNIVVVLDANVMPPTGMPNEAERSRLLSLARDFETAGDAALTREVELREPK